MKVRWIWLVALAVLLAAAMMVSLGVGAEPIPPLRVVRILTAGEEGESAPFEAVIVWRLRLPRILLAAVVGAGLGAAGAGFQGLFRNPLADPFVIGASSGAALGAAIALVAGWSWTVFGFGPTPLLAMAGALGAVALVYSIASVGRQTPTLSLLLAGVAVSSFLSAVLSLVMFRSEEKLITIFSWLMGSFSGRSWRELGAAAPLVLLGSSGLWLMARGLDTLAFGEESARSLGLRLPQFRALVVACASLATAAAVSAAGVIGFIGLIAPHMVRMLVGPRHALVIPGSALAGALLLVLADDVARTAAAPGEMPVGVVTALLGAPFFLFLLKRRQTEWRTP